MQVSEEVEQRRQRRSTQRRSGQRKETPRPTTAEDARVGQMSPREGGQGVPMREDTGTMP